MVKKLSAADSSRLERALATWERWREAPKKLPELHSQLGGDSNSSFVVTDGASRWVLRLNNPITDSGINRENERLALLAAFEAGLSPPPIFQSDEILVTPFLAGRPATLADLGKIGNLFSRIHALPLRLTPIDLLQHLHGYYEQASPDAVLTDCYRHIVESYLPDSVDLKPCHNDCLLPNIIASGQELRVLDWEYAAQADPAYDIAVFSTTYDLDRGQLVSLLSAYDASGESIEDLLFRIAYFEKYYRLIEILWWRLRGRDMGVELGVLFKSLDISNS